MVFSQNSTIHSGTFGPTRLGGKALGLSLISNSAMAFRYSAAAMYPPADPSQPHSHARSRILPGPPFLHHYHDYRLVAWRPEGVLDDGKVDQIAEWLVEFEIESPLFKRFIDFSRLTEIALRTSHIFEVARKRAEDFRGHEPVRAALFCDEWIGFGIARFYESLMEHTLIQAKAFRDRSEAAEWLEVPLAVLSLGDEPEA
jgi:hypothetical protein